MADDLILIKLGGSVLTDKMRRQTFREDHLARLVAEVVRFREQRKAKLIIAHGAGSFGHEAASKYQTKDGALDNNSLLGMAHVASIAEGMNSRVIAEFLKQKVPAVALSPRAMIVTKKQKFESMFAEAIKEILAVNGLPILFGDVVFDLDQGWTIYSSENVLSAVCAALKDTFQIQKLLLVSDTDGVYDGQGKTIPEITSKNFADVSQAIGKARGFDVTGGMRHKVEAALMLAKTGIVSHIINGTKPDVLYNTLLERDVKGTIIHS